MRRRGLLLAGAAGLVPMPARSQNPARPARIGWVISLAFDTWPLSRTFTEAMRERGWIEGTHYVVDAFSYDGRAERIPALAAELVRRNPDVIVAGGTPPIGPLMKATATIPIVMFAVGDPVGAGFVASLARPGGNVTGISAHDQGILAKQFELLVQAAPRAQRIGVVFNPDIRPHVNGLHDVEAAARRQGLVLRPVAMRSPDEIAATYEALARERVDAVHLFIQPFFNSHRDRLAALALQHRWPTASGFHEDARAGIMIAYGATLADSVRRLPYYVDRILKGAPPGEIPVEQPSRFYVTLNLKTARALGLALPQSLLLQADELIE